MTSRDWLVETVAQARRMVFAWWVIRWSALALGLAAAGLIVGLPREWLWSCVLVPLLAFWSSPDEHWVPRRMDRSAGLDAEVECAWDHRDEPNPIHVAQRDRARVRFLENRAARIVPVPHFAWGLPAFLWLAVPTATTIPHGSSMNPSTIATSESAEGSKGAGDPAKAAAAGEARDRAGATPSAPPPDPASPGVNGAESGKNIAGTGRTGGVGDRAGDRSGGASGRHDVPLGPLPAETVALGTAAGVAQPGLVVEGRALVGRSPPPPDAIADPSRRYPRRYHAVIAQWFDREKE